MKCVKHGNWNRSTCVTSGVHEKVDEKEVVEKYGITPVDTKWVDTDRSFEEEPMQIRSRMCARELKS